MRTFDFAPLWRSTVGFDRLFDMLADDSFRVASEQSYPPYNIERTAEDSYEIAVAVAGFTPDEIMVQVHDGVLTVEGRKTDKTERLYLYQGISGRAFRRQFNLADHVEVSGALFENGLLQIQLVREIPEAMKPRRIEVKSGGAAPRHVEKLKSAA